MNTAKLSLFTTLLCIFATGFYSCTPKVIPLKGTYIHKSYESNKSYDEVWSNAVDLIAEKGYEPKILDKSNGLIWINRIFSDTSFTMEAADGSLLNRNATTVASQIKNPGEDKPIKPLIMITYEMNIRIKPEKDKTVIDVNLVNFASVLHKSIKVKKESLIEFTSTGVFEKMIADIIK